MPNNFLDVNYKKKTLLLHITCCLRYFCEKISRCNLIHREIVTDIYYLVLFDI